MGIIILKNQRGIHAFQNDVLKSISLKGRMKNYIHMTCVCKVGVIFTSSQEEFIKKVKNYFESYDLKEFVGPLLLIETEDIDTFQNNNISWYDKKENIHKGESENNIYFRYQNNIISAEKKGHLLRVYLGNIESYSDFFPYFIKVVEAYIMKQHMHLGFMPVHGGLVHKEQSNYLILGDSQCGKTTLMKYLNSIGYECISDDIVFLDQHGNSYGFGHYMKEVIEEEMCGTNDILEEVNGFRRRIVRIKNGTAFEGHRIDRIIISDIKKQPEPTYEVVENIENELISRFNLLPNSFFLDEDYEYGLATLIIRQLEDSLVGHLYTAYEKKINGVEKLWEMC